MESNINPVTVMHGLRICTYNCRSLKNSLQDIISLCDSHDLICLQETWLLPSELHLLSNIHSDFFGVGTSAVDMGSDVLVGRPYGGTAILYRKSICNSISIFPVSNVCIAGVTIKTEDGPVLLLTVYMPTEYNDDASLEKYVEVCACLNAILMDGDTPHVAIAGDFNCQPGCRFYNVLKHLIDDNCLHMSDLSLLSAVNDVFTYCSDSGSCTSWIDHVLCSHVMNTRVSNMKILYDYICSDHRPLSFVLNCQCQITLPCMFNTDGYSSKPVFHDWSKVDNYIASMYSETLYEQLSLIEIPHSLRNCCNSRCDDPQHAVEIDNYYRDVIQCVSRSIDRVIPFRTAHDNQFNVPGWSDFVQEKYDVSREAFLAWVYCGRPRSGAVFTRMSRSRASFKLALRYCRQHEAQMRADACALSLDMHDSKGFWKNVQKAGCNKATKHATSVGGVCGDDNIASMWRDHFSGLYNSVEDDGSKDKFFARINSHDKLTDFSFISVQEIISAVSKQKKGKSAGPDGIPMEAFICGNTRLFVHLSLLFNLFIMHCHIPSMFMNSVIVPLVKVKGGDITDVNNYRAIALSNSVSKILECAFMNKVTSIDVCDGYQFGFKPGHSTGLCTRTFKKVVDYYTNHGSHVFVSFVDFSKAFDRVNYWRLFNKLLDDNIDSDIVALLAVWYSKQNACVQWKNTISSPFTIGNGTRQGGILSPYFFTRYIRDLITAIVHSYVGCNVGGVFYNILAYADDIVLLAPTWKALQSLINLLYQCAHNIDMICNAAKTVCMVFKPKCRRLIVASEFPCFTLNGVDLKFVSEFKYLGHMVNNDFSDDDDVKREIRNMFMRTNMLIRRYAKCSFAVKLILFKAYCMCLYDVGIWMQFSDTVFSKLRSCYNRCIKMFFGYSRQYSMSLLLTELNLPNFDSYFSSCVNSFNCRWSACYNNLIFNLNSMCI